MKKIELRRAFILEVKAVRTERKWKSSEEEEEEEEEDRLGFDETDGWRPQ